MASELAEAISEAVDSTSNHAELIDRVIAENGEVSCIYCGKVSFKGLAVENGHWTSIASKAMADHMLSCPNRPEAKLTERIHTLESACEVARDVLALLVPYGKIHTVNGVRYPDGTHSEAVDRGERILNELRTLVGKGSD